MTKIIAGLLILGIVFLQYKLWFDHEGLPQMLHLHREIAMQMQQNQQLTARNDGLEAEVGDLKTGHSAIEERARSQLGMIKEGETFYQVVRQENGVNQENNSSIGPALQKSQ